MNHGPSWEATTSSGSKRNSPHFVVPEDSLLFSPKPVTCPYPEPNYWIYIIAFYFFKIHFKIILSSLSRSSMQPLSFKFPHQMPVCISLVPHWCYMPCLSHVLDLIFKQHTNFKYIEHESYVYWTVHHLDSWIKRDQLDVTCFIISLFNAQHVSDVLTSKTCWALNNEIIKQATSSWYLFIQLYWTWFQKNVFWIKLT